MELRKVFLPLVSMDINVFNVPRREKLIYTYMLPPKKEGKEIKIKKVVTLKVQGCCRGYFSCTHKGVATSYNIIFLLFLLEHNHRTSDISPSSIGGGGDGSVKKASQVTHGNSMKSRGSFEIDTGMRR